MEEPLRPTQRILNERLGDPPSGRRWCRTCHDAKTENGFQSPTRLECRECRNAAIRRRRLEDEEWADDQRRRDRERYPDRREDQLAYLREYYQNNPDFGPRNRHIRRARKQAAKVESFNPTEIFDRDAWYCGLCGGKINPSLKYPHPKSVSLDHIVPLAAGGGHTRKNSQASHLRCNLKKNAGGGGQLLLFG